MIVLYKLWEWIKSNWKWIIFPVGLLGLLGTALASAAGRRRISTVPSPHFSEQAEEAMDDIQQATLQRDLKLAELQIKHRRRINELRKDRREELETLKDKPIEEVVKWFDRL